jgi:hypothetical protein
MLSRDTARVLANTVGLSLVKTVLAMTLVFLFRFGERKLVRTHLGA